MGQHTWFEKDQKKYDEVMEIYERIDAHEEGITWEENIDGLHAQAETIHEENDTNYHDVFRTNKRNEDGSYTEDEIRSRKECAEWLKNNPYYHYYEDDKEMWKTLDKFWKENPNGLIYFG